MIDDYGFSSLTIWQMEYGCMYNKGRPDRISLLQRPRICLERKRDRWVNNGKGYSIGHQSISINIKMAMMIIMKHYQWQNEYLECANAKAIYQLSMSIRNPSLTYFPSLVQGVPTEVKRNKKRKEKQWNKRTEAGREQIHPWKKHWPKS